MYILQFILSTIDKSAKEQQSLMERQNLVFELLNMGKWILALLIAGGGLQSIGFLESD